MKNLLIVLSVLLCGCVGDAKEAPEGTTPLNANFDKSRITGVWELNSETDDEYYISIRADGYLVEYDYDGDSIGSGDNCYKNRTFKMESYGGGNFTLTSGGHYIDVAFVVTDSGLILVSTDRDSYSKSSFFESDFQPICI